MARLSMSEATTYRWSFEEDVAAYAEAGIPAIGVWRHKLSDYGEAKAAELLQQAGLSVAHLFWAGGFTGSDGHTYKESVEDAREALLAAAEIGAESLVVYSGPRAGHTHNHARRLLRDALRELAPMAAELGVWLALEPMHPGCAGPWTFLTSIDDVLAVLAAVQRPAVKLVFDTYHLGQEPGVLERLTEIVPHLALVQLGDARRPPSGEQNRCRLGEGSIPLCQIVAGLQAAGYDGYYDVELLGEEIEACDYAGLLQHAKDAFAKLLVAAPC